MERTSSQNWFWTEWIIIIGRFSSVRSDRSVLKWNVRVLRTGSGQNAPAHGYMHGSEPLGSPVPDRRKRGILESCGEKKCTCAPWTFPNQFFLAGQNGRIEKDLGVNEVCTSAQCMMYNELHNLASCIVHR